MHQSIKHTASAVFFLFFCAFWLDLPLREPRIVHGLIVLYIKILITQNYIIFKISATCLFLKYPEHFSRIKKSNKKMKNVPG